MNQYEYINKFKYLGAISILIYHASGLFGVPELCGNMIYYFEKYGWLPVEFFFWTSGFFMQKMYWQRINKKEIVFGQYLYKRIKKIFPLYAICSITCGIIKVAIEKQAVTMWDFAVNVFMVNTGYYNINSDWRNAIGNVTWYIGVLMTCYFLFYFLCKWVSDEENLIFIYCISSLVSSIGLMFWDAPFFNFYMLRGILGFSAGALYCILLRNRMVFCSSRRLKLAAAVVLILWYGETLYEQILGNAKLIIIFDGMIIPALLCIIENVMPLKKWLNKGHRRFPAGTISSYIYFLHYPLCYLLAYIYSSIGMASNNWGVYVIAIILVNAVGIVCSQYKSVMNRRKRSRFD